MKKKGEVLVRDQSGSERRELTCFGIGGMAVSCLLLCSECLGSAVLALKENFEAGKNSWPELKLIGRCQCWLISFEQVGYNKVK